MSEEQLARLREVLAAHEANRGSLIPILQEVQAALGYLPEAAMSHIARHIGVSPSQVYGVAGFFAQFHLTPRGRTILSVCQGTACHVQGATRVMDRLAEHLGIKEGETTPDGEYTLESVACVGCCALAPCVVVDHDEVHGRLDPRAAVAILAEGKRGRTR